jgi:serine kinase of HPr protein (carbohydrate metabolism regulator)
MNYPAASSGVSIREKSKALRRKRRGIQPKEIQCVTRIENSSRQGSDRAKTKELRTVEFTGNELGSMKRPMKEMAHIASRESAANSNFRRTSYAPSITDASACAGNTCATHAQETDVKLSSM